MTYRTRWIGFVLLGVIFSGDVLAQSSPSPSPPAPALPPPLSAEKLAGISNIMKNVVVQNLPVSPSFVNSHDWGHQAMVPTLQGLRIVHVLRNHGNWQETRATCVDLPHNLELRLSDMQARDAEHITFKIFLALPTKIEFHQQIWQNGLLVMKNHARARMHIKADISIETSIKLDTKGGLLPDVLVGFKIADAAVSYDKLVVENIDGIGGDAARITGDAVRGALKRWKPSLERDLLAKARTAILRAGETREVRVSLSKLVKLK